METPFRVLVIDDDTSWLKVMQLMLQKRGNVEITTATSLEEAVRLIGEKTFDYALTDVELIGESRRLENGLELISAIEQADLHIPVIAVTGKGDEQSAIDALRRGATSYISKINIRVHLGEALDAVEHSIFRKQKQDVLKTHLEHCEFRYRLPSDTSVVPSLIEELKASLIRGSQIDRRTRGRILIAVEEAVLNSIIHGNLEISSEIRNESLDDYYALIAERSQSVEYGNRRVQVEFKITGSRFEAELIDEGPGFDFTAVADPREEENLSIPSGRGLLLIREFMDMCVFSDGGRRLSLCKMISPDASRMRRSSREAVQS